MAIGDGDQLGHSHALGPQNLVVQRAVAAVGQAVVRRKPVPRAAEGPAGVGEFHLTPSRVVVAHVLPHAGGQAAVVDRVVCGKQPDEGVDRKFGHVIVRPRRAQPIQRGHKHVLGQVAGGGQRELDVAPFQEAVVQPVLHCAAMDPAAAAEGEHVELAAATLTGLDVMEVAEGAWGGLPNAVEGAEHGPVVRGVPHRVGPAAADVQLDGGPPALVHAEH